MIQVAGARSLDEAAMLARCGATHIGLPLGPGVREQDVSIHEAARMAAALGREVVFACITYLCDPGEVAALCRAANVRAVQLHGETSPQQVDALRALWPGLFIIRSLVVGAPGTSSLEDLLPAARAVEPHVDAFLTDTYDLASGARGATGKTHDWATSRALVQALRRPVIVAGGLGPGNVADAITATGCAGVDAHTGLEDAAGRKDEGLVRAFVDRALQARGR